MITSRIKFELLNNNMIRYYVEFKGTRIELFTARLECNTDKIRFYNVAREALQELAPTLHLIG